MSVRLLGIGTNVPRGGMTQGRAATLSAQRAGLSGGRAAALGVLYEKSGVRRRGFVIADGDGVENFYSSSGEGDPSTAARMERYAKEAPGLALPACERALAHAWGAERTAREVTHLVVASCTGFSAPGLDQAIVRGLGLRADVRRTVVGFMGCHAAVNALAVARGFCAEDPHAVALVCCTEICGLHFSRSLEDGAGVANALFADGAAAVVVGSDGAGKNSLTLPALRSTHAILLPDSEHCMTWRIGVAGFAMTLAASVPTILARHVPAWVESCLRKEGLGVNDVRGWAIHPGGPRVVSALVEGMGLRAEAGAASLEVMGGHGNMSSPTVLFILEKLWKAQVPKPWVAMAFGPGLAGEMALFL